MRLPGNLAQDLVDLAKLPAVLADIAEALVTIQAMVASLDGEVTRMRRAVEGIGGTVEVMNDSVKPLDERLREVHAGFDRIEPAISDIGRALRPWRRGGRAG
jgi:predicted  nucleic acid-binding Zn-ribbon protein